MRKTKLFSTLTLLAALALAPARLHAENLAARVPADALLFSQWAGSDALGASYDNSNLKGLLDTLNIPQLLADQMQKHEAKETDPQKLADMKAVHDLIPLLVKAQTALYVGPIDVSIPNDPQVKIAFFSKIGKTDADKYAASLTDIIKRKEAAAPPDKKHPPVAVISAGEFLLVTVGENVDIEKHLTGAAPDSPLSGSEPFKAAMAQIHASDSSAVVGYLNGDATLKTIDDAIASGSNPRFSQMWPVVEDALGVSAIQSAAWGGTFDGKDFHSEAFIGLRQRRVGIVDFLDSTPLTDADLKLIPKAAPWAGITRFDGTRLLGDLRNAFTAAGPKPAKQFDFALQQFFAFTGVDLEKDLFASLSDEYAFYGTPDETGKSFGSFTLVSKLKDAAKADTALSSLESSISAMVTQHDPNGTTTFTTQPLAAPFDKVTAHIITTPVVAPVWAVSDGNLYVSVDLKSLQAAVAAGKDSSILDNPTFAAARAKLAPKSFSAFFFDDMVATAPETYAIVNDALTQLKTERPDTVTYTLPPLEQITPHLSTTLGFFSADADGFHATVTGPFPLSNALSPQSMIMRKFMMQAAQRRRMPPPQPAMP